VLIEEIYSRIQPKCNMQKPICDIILVNYVLWVLITDSIVVEVNEISLSFDANNVEMGLFLKIVDARHSDMQL
jgi:hypothetical protein